jgi:hypothetical protein
MDNVLQRWGDAAESEPAASGPSEVASRDLRSDSPYMNTTNPQTIDELLIAGIDGDRFGGHTFPYSVDELEHTTSTFQEFLTTSPQPLAFDGTLDFSFSGLSNNDDDGSFCTMFKGESGAGIEPCDSAYGSWIG